MSIVNNFFSFKINQTIIDIYIVIYTRIYTFIYLYLISEAFNNPLIYAIDGHFLKFFRVDSLRLEDLQLLRRIVFLLVNFMRLNEANLFSQK